MKKFTLSVIASLAMGSFAVAGGDIVPVVEPVVEAVTPAAKTGFYVGGAISAIQNDFRAFWRDSDGSENTWAIGNTDHVGGMLQVGYKFNKYLSVETRYWISRDEDWSDEENWGNSEDYTFTTGFDAMGLYLKPIYPLTDAFDVYALVGIANINYDLTYYEYGSPYAHREFGETAFSYGVGVSYAYNDSLAFFVDYVKLYDDEIMVFDYSNWDGGSDNADISSATWNFGVTYSF